MTPIFSCLHATLGRPTKAAAAMRTWFDRAAHPELVEYIFACDSSDPTAHALLDDTYLDRLAGKHIEFVVDFGWSVPAWNAAAAKSTGRILIQAQDDVEPPEKWDVALMDAILKQAGGEGLNIPTVVAVSDGYRHDRLLCTAICSRARYVQQGHFLSPAYMSVYSDGEFTLRAYLDAKAGTCKLVEARDLIFRHEHCYHNKTVPEDATYRHENSGYAYDIGISAFTKRNPGWRESGIVDWM